MGFLAGLALFLLGLELVHQGFARFRGRRHLLARALGRPGRTLAFGLLMGLLSGSGSGLSLLALALLESRVLSLALAGLLSLAATAGAALWVGVVALGPGGAAEVLLVLGMLLFLPPGSRSPGLVLLGLGLLLLGFGYMGEGAQGVAARVGLEGLSLAAYYLLGLALAFLLGSANGVAALALALGPSLPPGAPLALVLGGGVGTSGTLFLAGLLGRREGLALGTAVGAHRLLLSLLLFPLLPGLEGVGVVGLHLLSHLLYALAFLPLYRGYARLAEGLFPRPLVAPKYLSPEALESPLLAQALVQRELGRVADTVRAMLAKAVRILSQEEGEAELAALEEKVDRLTREVVLYTAQLSTRAGDGRAVKLFVAASQLEHLGDLVRRVVRQAEKLWAQGLAFSPEGKEDLLEAARLVLRRLETAAAALTTGEKRLAQEVLREGAEAAAFWERLRRAHLLRLEGGRQESRATTLAHLDLLITLEEFSAGVERLCRLVLEL